MNSILLLKNKKVVFRFKGWKSLADWLLENTVQPSAEGYDVKNLKGTRAIISRLFFKHYSL